MHAYQEPHVETPMHESQEPHAETPMHESQEPHVDTSTHPIFPYIQDYVSSKSYQIIDLSLAKKRNKYLVFLHIFQGKKGATHFIFNYKYL